MPPKVNADVNSVSRASCKTQSGWLAQTIEAIRVSGCMVVEDVLSSSQVDETRDHLYQVQEKL